MVQRTLRFMMLSLPIIMLYDTDVSGDETRAKRLISSTDQSAPATDATGPETVRVAAVQAKRRLIDWRIKDPTEALAAVDENLAADIIFFPTMGGAAVGDDDIGLQALRVRAAENHVYLVVAFRGSGSMIISPRGKILARAEGPDGLAISDVDPRGGRQGGDAMNHQPDMRARLFRERNTAAFGILTDPNPPVLQKVPINITQQEAGRIAARVLTVGEEEFRQAETLAREGKIAEAITAFERLRNEYRGSWIDRVAAQRLQTLRRPKDQETP